MGQVLRRVREALDLNLGEISRSSLIRENFLMAIERMELQTIAKGYLVPYLIAYSKYLGQVQVQRFANAAQHLAHAELFALILAGAENLVGAQAATVCVQLPGRFMRDRHYI